MKVTRLGLAMGVVLGIAVLARWVGTRAADHGEMGVGTTLSVTK